MKKKAQVPEKVPFKGPFQNNDIIMIFFTLVFHGEIVRTITEVVVVGHYVPQRIDKKRRK